MTADIEAFGWELAEQYEEDAVRYGVHYTHVAVAQKGETESCGLGNSPEEAIADLLRNLRQGAQAHDPH